MSELPSKRQKLEHRWILTQVSDLSVPDDVKNAAANAYQELDAEDVRGASFEDLAALLQTEDAKARAAVILRLRNRLRPTSQTAEPAGSATALPTPSSERKFDIPTVADEDFKEGKLLNVSGFTPLLAKNTEADKPIFLREHLLQVHDVSVATLKDNGDKMLVSLVGCPGTGKTWCGWLVANTLQCKHNVQTLHLTIRGTDVIAIWADDGQYRKRTYKKVDVSTSMLLEQVLADSKCKVCIIDVGDLFSHEVKTIFRGAHRILEDDSNVIKFMGLVSGHGEEDIVGNQFNIQQKAHTLVLWSWSEKEFEAFHDKFNSSKENKTGHELDKNIYRICGGSVRGCFQPDGAQAEIFRTVKMLSQDEKDNFLIVNTRPTSSAEHKQRSHLLAFFPAKEDSDFKHGVAHANQVPRSDYVIQCIRADTQSSPKRVKEMYAMLSDYNPGAAGTAFEMLVHFFWKHVVETELDVKLTLDWRHDDKPTQSIEVKGGELQGYNSQAIEEYDNEKKIAAGGLTGYFTPKDFKYPVLDSLLRYKHGDAVMVLAIQISIAKTHQHGELVQNTLLKEEAEGEPKPKLALWDFKAKGKQCKWTPTTSDHWDLMYVESEAFTQWFDQI